MKKITLFTIITLFLAFSTANAQYLRGGFNDWGNTGIDFQMDLVDGWYTYTFQYSGTSGDVEYKIDQNNDWSMSWGKNINATVNTLKGKATKGWGDNLSNSLTDAKYYTFKLGGESNWDDRDIIVFETDEMVANILSVSDDSISATSDLTVTITMDKNTVQDSLYIRYTMDNWASVSLMKTSHSGNASQYTFTIADIPEGAIVQYYLLTSTFPKVTLAAEPDVYYLNRNTNGGDNYSYTSPVSTQLEDLSSFELIVTCRNSQLTVEVSTPEADDISVSMVSLSGQLVSTFQTKVLPGSNSILLPQEFNAGIYVLKAQIGNTRLVRKIAIQ